MKPTDKAILGMVSESPGRNASEPVVASTKNELRRPSPLMSGEGSMAWRRLTDAPHHCGGVVRGSTVTRTSQYGDRALCWWRPASPRWTHSRQPRAVRRSHRSGPMASKDLPECLQQRRPLLPSRRPQRHPSASSTPNSTELKAQKSKALARRQVHAPTLLLVHLDLQLRQLLPQSLFHRPAQPTLPRMDGHQHHEIISKPRVFQVRPLLIACDGLRSLQHAVDLGEGDVTEQGRNDAALGNALPARRFQNQSEEPPHRVIAYPPSDFLEYDVMSHRIEIRSPVEVDDLGLALNDCLRAALDRRGRGLLRAVAIRPGLEVGFEDRFQDEFQRTLHHTIAD
jgi:hypothetical protein